MSSVLRTFVKMPGNFYSTTAVVVFRFSGVLTWTTLIGWCVSLISHHYHRVVHASVNETIAKVVS